MIGRFVGNLHIALRDFLARRLVRIGVTPNMLTLTGMVITTLIGVCLAIGAGSDFGWSLSPAAPANLYLLIAMVLMWLASACDILDGAVARLAGKSTRFGAFLDSTLDRYSDFAIYAGIAVHYAIISPANATFVLLCMIAFFNAFMISYTRARAEDLIERCKVGYWQRGERSAAIFIAVLSYNIPAMVLQQALLPAITVLRRIFYTKAVLEGKTPIEDPRLGPWWMRIQLWRYRRMSLPYDIVTLANIAWLLLARFEARDVLREWFT